MERRLGGEGGCASGASTARQRQTAAAAVAQGQQRHRPSSASSRSPAKHVLPRLPMFAPSGGAWPRFDMTAELLTSLSADDHICSTELYTVVQLSAAITGSGGVLYTHVVRHDHADAVLTVCTHAICSATEIA